MRRVRKSWAGVGTLTIPEIIRRVAICVGAVCLCMRTVAQEGYYGAGHDGWHTEFYSKLNRSDGQGTCCNLMDYRPTQSRMVGDHYEVKVDGEWTPVPNDKINNMIAPDGGAAVICFEWLQRPENVIGGYLTWPDYRPADFPHALRIVHHKTGAIVWHPLEEITSDGPVQFYPEAEAVLAHLPRRGVPMILQVRSDGTCAPFTIIRMGKRVRRIRLALALPATFTLDACRHGGMTELEEAELTDGQGRALSGHRTQRAYQGYAKRTLERALPATRKRYAHRLANAQGTEFQNAPRLDIQNDENGNEGAIA